MKANDINIWKCRNTDDVSYRENIYCVYENDEESVMQNQ